MSHSFLRTSLLFSYSDVTNTAKIHIIDLSRVSEAGRRLTHRRCARTHARTHTRRHADACAHGARTHAHARMHVHSPTRHIHAPTRHSHAHARATRGTRTRCAAARRLNSLSRIRAARVHCARAIPRPAYARVRAGVQAHMRCPADALACPCVPAAPF
eukprot:6190540-Pleurochrysis_carterae.AAC.2